MNPNTARAVLVALALLTLAACWFVFGVLLLLWRRARRIDARNLLLDQRFATIDSRVAAIGRVIVDLYPEHGAVSETRAAKKAKALGVLRSIDDHDMDVVRLAIHEVTRETR